ncbi:MAG: hypothetical protein N2C14_18060, partial [Planctomycetales bacterium]
MKSPAALVVRFAIKSLAALVVRFAFRCAVAITAVALSGCAEYLDNTYGQQRTSGSVNGTTVLQKLFRDAGHQVTTRRRLTPVLNERVDCLVWTPGKYDPPSKANREWLEAWLRGAPRRVLVLVVRDYDGAPDYWAEAVKKAPKEKQKEFRSRLQAAEVDFDSELLGRPEETSCPWYAQRNRVPLPKNKPPNWPTRPP